MNSMKFSFIDYGLKDFLRDKGEVIIKRFTCQEEAEDWLLREGANYGFTNEGVKYFIW